MNTEEWDEENNTGQSCGTCPNCGSKIYQSACVVNKTKNIDMKIKYEIKYCYPRSILYGWVDDKMFSSEYYDNFFSLALAKFSIWLRFKVLS